MSTIKDNFRKHYNDNAELRRENGNLKDKLARQEAIIQHSIEPIYREVEFDAGPPHSHSGYDILEAAERLMNEHDDWLVPDSLIDLIYVFDWGYDEDRKVVWVRYPREKDQGP